MNIQDNFFLVKKHFLNVNNIITMIVLILINIIIFSSLTVIAFYFSFKSNYQNDVLNRTLIVYNENSSDNKIINNINNVELVENVKYLNDIYRDAKLFDTKTLKGEIILHTLIDKNDVSIVYGRNIEKSGEVICPQNFYPHYFYANDEAQNTKIYKSLYVNGSDYIGKSFKVNSKNSDYDNQDFEFKIVGTYKPLYSSSTINTCYLSKKDYDLISAKNLGEITSTLVDGTTEVETVEWKDLFVRVNNYNNVENVKKDIELLGYKVSYAQSYDNDMVNIILYIPIFIVLIVIIISFCLLYNFIKKKVKKRYNYYGLLTAIGFKNKDIKKMEISENSVMYIFSFLLSFIIYFVIYHILINGLFAEIIFSNYIIKIPGAFILLVMILYLSLIIIETNLCIDRTLQKDIRISLGEN